MSGATRTAAVWFARHRAAPLADEERRAFEAWLAEDPEHAIAYAEAERAWAVADAVREGKEAVPQVAVHPHFHCGQDRVAAEGCCALDHTLRAW